MEEQTPPRVDFISGLGWIVFGGAIVIGSWRMDRLESMHINPYTAPGLVPGILGAFLALFGAIMAYRAIRQGAFDPVRGRAGSGEPIFNRRVLVSAALCILFAAGMVGHGPPFWAAAVLFLFVHVFLFEFPERQARGEVKQGLIVAASVAVGAAFAVTVIFQELFLVRLP